MSFRRQLINLDQEGTQETWGVDDYSGVGERQNAIQEVLKDETNLKAVTGNTATFKQHKIASIEGKVVIASQVHIPIIFPSFRRQVTNLI